MLDLGCAVVTARCMACCLQPFVTEKFVSTNGYVDAHNKIGDLTENFTEFSQKLRMIGGCPKSFVTLFVDIRHKKCALVSNAISRHNVYVYVQIDIES